jgi:DNA-binding NarL/FixJ family response regulator
VSIRVTIVEDRAEVREGLAALIDVSDGFTCLARFEDAESFLDAVAPNEGDAPDLDIALMDIGLPGMSGIEAVRELRRRRPEIQAMMLTVYEDDDHVFEALRSGATGYVLKTTPPDELLDAMRQLHEGGSPMSSGIARRVVEAFHRPPLVPEDESPLTPREEEILELLVQGFRYREIAERLFISIDTVRTHVRHIYEKMHVRSRAEAAQKYYGRT